jgi:uroporphyrinogen-III synthase
MRPLTGHCIVTTRPAAQAENLVRALQAAGAEVLNFPVIAIAAADPGPLLATDLSRFQLAFFVSPNAVEHALSILPRPQWPAHLRVAAVGPATRQALIARGFTDILCPEHDFDSEGVLALPEFSQSTVAGQNILILRGNGGRETFAETLRSRGARVEALCCYQRSCARLDPSPLIERFHDGTLSALVFSASEGLQYFLDILGPNGSAMLATLPAFAPHPRICEALRAAGAPTPALLPGGDAGIVAGLIAMLPQRTRSMPE